MYLPTIMPTLKLNSLPGLALVPKLELGHEGKVTLGKSDPPWVTPAGCDREVKATR